MEKKNILFCKQQKIDIVKLSGNISGDNANDIKNRAVKYESKNGFAEKVIVDLSSIEHLDSSGLSCILIINRLLKNNNRISFIRI